ncbi:hypothetical protein I8752_09615 [Nostocaceae cyanobacterium CENA369]|uniref:Uncharacterized protein n=2 Tax=Dendronalium TaxID=2840442 RepID=A0A8J7HZP2_9NOST|nr:hypothetical protein [Dendronalium phyllosphericum CENA369]
MFSPAKKVINIKFDRLKAISSKQYSFTSLNVEKLKGALSYFSHLHTTGEISDKAFETLVNHACSIFIENEVEFRVNEVIERKVIQFLNSKFSVPTEEIEDTEAAIYSLELSRIMRNQ